MALALLTKPNQNVKPSAVKAAPVYSGTISARGTATGIVTRMPAAADEVRLVVLNAVGEVVSEQAKAAAEVGLITLNFSASLVEKAGKEMYFLMVKGYLKGNLAWEQRLGRFSFHS
jgi:hypothetical protein